MSPSMIPVSSDGARSFEPWWQRACLLILCCLVLGIGSAGCGEGQSSDPTAVTQRVDASSQAHESEKTGPRWEGRLRQQTEVEERFAKEWQPPTGDSPVFTQNWIRRQTGFWQQYLGHLKGRPNVKALEIGSFEGRSALWFAENILTGPGSTLTCVDLFGERLDQFFDHNVRVSGNEEKIIKLKGRSQQVLYELPDKEGYDFIYVDGCHLGTCALVDIILSWHLLKQDGVLVIDDYGWPGPALDRPKIAVDAFLEIFGPHLRLLHKEHQVIVRKESAGY